MIQMTEIYAALEHSNDLRREAAKMRLSGSHKRTLRFKRMVTWFMLLMLF